MNDNMQIVSKHTTWLHNQFVKASEYEHSSVEETQHFQENPLKNETLKAHLNQHLGFILAAQNIQTDIKQFEQYKQHHLGDDRKNNQLSHGPSSLQRLLCLICRGSYDVSNSSLLAYINKISQNISSCTVGTFEEVTSG